MDPSFSIESPRAGVHRKGTAARLGWTALLALTVACPASMALDPWLTGDLRAAGVWLATVAPIVFALGALIAQVPPLRGGVVAFEPGGVRLPRGRLIPRARVLGGWIVPYAGRRRVELLLRGGNAVVIDVADVAEGERVLAAAGVSSAQSRLDVRSGTGLDTANTLVFGPMLGLLSGGIAVTVLRGLWSTMPQDFADALVFACACALPVALFALRAASRVVVGADGLTLYNGPLWRFVPFAAVASVAQDPSSPNRLVVQLVGGRRAKLSVAGLSREERAALGARIQAALQLAASAGPAPSLELLDRRARPLAAWRAALRELTTPAVGYRARAVTREDLLRVLDDASASAERRLAAALALVGTRDDAGALARVRVASATCASEPLRVALERAADDSLDEPTLERATRDTLPGPLRRRV